MSMRVLLVAEAANPTMVSVPLIGWRLSRALAELCDVHVVTQVRNEEAIREAGLGSGEFTAIDSELLARPLYRIAQALRGGGGRGWTTVAALSVVAYYYFEHLVWRVLGKRIAAGEFDLVHRITPLSPTRPSLIAPRLARAGVPFVLGPLNGGLPWPRSFASRRCAEREWLSYVRGAYRLLPGYSATRRRAAAIITGSRATAAEVPVPYRDRCVYIPENAVDPAALPAVRRTPPRRPLRVAFAGRLVPYKGADMLIEAAAPLVRSGRVVLDIIGDGPQMKLLRAFVAREEIERGVRFAGWLDHAQVPARLARSDVFGFPSIREFGGAVVLEAMALGLVPLVVDYGGPAEFVTPSTGRTVPVGAARDIVRGFRRELERMVADPGELQAFGDRARRRVLTYFTWPVKAQQVVEVYRWVLGRRGKPDFGMPFPDMVLEAPGRDAAGQGQAAAPRAAGSG